MPGEKLLCIRPVEGKESFVGCFVAAKQTLRFQRFEIQPVEERSIPVRRRPGSCKIDRIAVLAKDPLSVRQLAHHGVSRVGIMLIGGKIEDHAGLSLWIIDIDDGAVPPVPVVIPLAQQSGVLLTAPMEANITLPGPRNFHGWSGERSLLKQDLVASRNIRLPVAAVKRLRPNQRRRLV